MRLRPIIPMETPAGAIPTEPPSMCVQEGHLGTPRARLVDTTPQPCGIDALLKRFTGCVAPKRGLEQAGRVVDTNKQNAYPVGGGQVKWTSHSRTKL